MEICDMCGKPIKEVKIVLANELEGIYHQKCADKILGIETN